MLEEVNDSPGTPLKFSAPAGLIAEIKSHIARSTNYRRVVVTTL
jgi:hypothetical protein